MSLNRDIFKFLLGFMGMISIGMSFLIAIGFYQLEISGKNNFSASGVAISVSNLGLSRK